MPPFHLRSHRSYHVALLLAALVGILFLRRPDAFLRPQFWAEDFGFLLSAEQHGLASLGTPQAGYLYILPRIIALAATLLDPMLQPIWYLVAALAGTLAVCGSFFSSRLELPNKSLLALAVVALPQTGEVFFNPTNLQWIVALGILGTALKGDPRTVSDWCVDLGFLVVGGLTGPMMLFALPLLLARVWQRRTKASILVLLIGTAITAIQASFVLGLAPESTEPFDVVGLGANVAFHLFGSVFLGVWATPALPKIAAMVVAALVAALVGLVVVTSGRHRPALLSMLAFSVLVLAAASVLKRLDAWDYGDLRHGDRYFYVSKMILVWILAIGSVAATHRWVRYGTIAALVLALACNAARFRFVPHPDFGWYAACPRIRAGDAVVVTIDPGWKFYYRRGSPDSRFLPRREVENFERK
jgi:hypothetical protein